MLGSPRPPGQDVSGRDRRATETRSRWPSSRFRERAQNAEKFERALAESEGARHGVLMANGTVTMEVALKALGIGWGDEVIVPALTFSATPYAVIAACALPVFCDVDPDTLTLDPDRAEAAVTPRTRAVMPVHLGHQMADMDRLMQVARRHSLAVGGGRAHSLIDCGRPKDPDEKHYTFGANFRLGELQAALLLLGLERFPGQQAERADAGRRFQRLAAAVPGVRLVPPHPRGSRWSFYCYVLRIDPELFAGAGNRRGFDAVEGPGVWWAA